MNTRLGASTFMLILSVGNQATPTKISFNVSLLITFISSVSIHYRFFSKEICRGKSLNVLLNKTCNLHLNRDKETEILSNEIYFYNDFFSA